jgi:sarcosine oxidase subunit beta
VIAADRGSSPIVIVGAGIVGLYTAHRLLASGAGPVVVLERGFLSSGASGRNGGGVRQQWETPETVRLARESVHEYRRFGRDFGYNIWFRQGGYLFLAETAEEEARLDRVHRAVTGERLPAERLSTAEVHRRVPELELAGVRSASFLRSDGTLYPFPAIWGLYEAVRGAGGDVRLGVEVTSVESEGGRVTGVTTRGGSIPCSKLVNAAGGWSGDLSRKAGLTVANRPTRHEILATEALKPFLDPMVIRLRDGLYFSQTMRGEIVGGLTLAHPPGTDRGMPSSIEFLRRMAAALTGLVPRLAGLGVLRAWSGFYDDTPDGFPVIGEDPRLRGFYHANGFGGHGFMLAPASSRRVARSVMGERTDLDPELFSPARFLDPHRSALVERLQPG